MAQNPDIAIAIRRFQDRFDGYRKTERYYNGTHDLRFATEKFQNTFGDLFREFALNLCPAVVDAVRDKLIVTEFGVETGGQELADEAWRIWQANRMPTRAGQVHKEAVMNGDGYVIVWPDAAGRVTIYPNRASTCTAVYDEETPGRILWAAKQWKTADNRFRLNLYYPDRIERYIAKADESLRAGDPLRRLSIMPTDPAAYLPMDGDGNPIVANPYGVVPVFHFANNADISMCGRSELASAIPIQDALNKSVLDMMVAMEFASYRQRWASGIEIEYDEKTGEPIPPFKAGIERLWITENGEAKFGDFEATDLKQFLDVKQGFRTDMASVTGTPVWYFMHTEGDFPSGEAIKKSETRFINKVRDRQETFGQVWEDVMSFALAIENKGGTRLFAKWEDPEPVSESERLSNLVMKQQLGVSDEQLMMEAGYGAADIKRIFEEKQAARDRAVASFNAGEGDATVGQ